MNKNNFTLSEIFKINPSELYEIWLSTDGHSKVTGSPAHIDGRIGGKFSAWDGYISGTTLELDTGKRIVQAWRTTEFPDEAPDSHIEIVFEETDTGTKLTLVHSNIPENQVDSYRQGWEDFYFKPMREYFGE